MVSGVCSENEADVGDVAFTSFTRQRNDNIRPIVNDPRSQRISTWIVQKLIDGIVFVTSEFIH